MRLLIHPVSQKAWAILKIKKVGAAPIFTGNETERSPPLLERASSSQD